MVLVKGLASIVLLASAAAVQAQPGSQDDVLRRLDRLERQVDRLERELDRYAGRRDEYRRPSPQQEVVASVSELCGADCGMTARSYCQRTGYRNGVALRIEKRDIGNFDHVVQVRCFN